jgi:hypothetical protein
MHEPPARIAGQPGDDGDEVAARRKVFREPGCVRADPGRFGPVVDPDNENAHPVSSCSRDQRSFSASRAVAEASLGLTIRRWRRRFIGIAALEFGRRRGAGARSVVPGRALPAGLVSEYRGGDRAPRDNLFRGMPRAYTGWRPVAPPGRDLPSTAKESQHAVIRRHMMALRLGLVAADGASATAVVPARLDRPVRRRPVDGRSGRGSGWTSAWWPPCSASPGSRRSGIAGLYQLRTRWQLRSEARHPAGDDPGRGAHALRALRLQAG